MLTTFHMGHYHPLTWITFALDHALWGMDARGYHLTNVALHAANAALVYVLARAMLVRAGTTVARQTGAALAALLFALHPLRVESVAWVTERRDVLSTFFLLLTVLAWLRFLAGRAVGWYAVALGCFVLSLGAKAWGMTLPAVLLVVDVWPLRRFGREPLARLVGEKLPFLAVAGGAALVAFVAQRSAGAMADAAHLTPGQRLMQAFYGLAFYVRKSLVPTRLSPAYLLDVHLDPMAPTYLVSALAVLVAAGALVAARRRWPAGLTAFSCYAILVLPVLGLTQAGIQIAADRYAYVAGIPLALLAGGAFAAAGRVGAALAGVVLVVLGIMTWRQTAVWHDSIALWNHTLAVDPDNWLAYNSRGIAHQKAGDLTPARADFDAAIRLAPRYAGAYTNRGHLRVAAEDVTGALEDWNRALEIAPHYPDALLNRGSARLMQGDLAGGVADLEGVLRSNPQSAQAWYNLATAHAVQGQLEVAVQDCRRALDMTPPGHPLRPRIETKLAALLAETGG